VVSGLEERIFLSKKNSRKLGGIPVPNNHCPFIFIKPQCLSPTPFGKPVKSEENYKEGALTPSL